MAYEQRIVFRHPKGLHTRVAAMVVQRFQELRQRYGSEITLRKETGKVVPANNLMFLVGLKVRAGDVLWVGADGAKAGEAAQEMAAFLEGDFSLAAAPAWQGMDAVLQENAFTAEQIFRSIASGLMVTDQEDRITVFNPAAERIMGVAAAEVIGRKVYEAIPGSRLHIVNQTGEAELGQRQLTGRSITVTNRTPLLIDGKVCGAVAVFEDISILERVSGELQEVKELKERLQLILESVQDGICVFDKKGVITYVNDAYVAMCGEKREELLGQRVGNISPGGGRSLMLTSGQAVLGSISRKRSGVTLISNINPIFVDGALTGGLSVSKNTTELQLLADKLNEANARADYLEEELLRTRRPHAAFRNFIGRSGKVRDCLAMASKAAAAQATVLIRGESGTGKELVAEGIHYASPRAKGPFIRVNCGAIPSALLESELFGHEKGAFTGAVRRKLGRFELADGGSLFLDEIGEMDKTMQVKLLRVLQQREIERVGGEETVRVDVRIIAATHRDLEAMVAAGEFREDLYYRLNVVPVLLPPLRERKEDIPLLAEYFLEKVSQREGFSCQGFQREAMEAFQGYNWPGNVRELENVVERMVTLTEGVQLGLEDLPLYLRKEMGVEPALPVLHQEESLLPWTEYEKNIIALALERCGSYNAAGKALGLTHKTIAAKARKYGLEKQTSWVKMD